MKTSFWKYVALAVAAAPGLASAQQQPGDAPGPAHVPPGAGRHAFEGGGYGPNSGYPGPSMHHGPIHLQKGAYLGVSVGPVEEALRDQLKLPEGTGLVVDFVVEGSPAESAGIKKSDVLQKLDDQLLINPEQLSVLVRTHKAGDEVKLSIVREAQPTTISVKLVEKELPSMGEGMFPGGGGMGGLRGPGARGGGPMPPHHHAGDVLTSPDGSVHAGASAAGNTHTDVETSITWIDGEQTITVHDKNGHRNVSVKDKDGKVVFEGPVDTAEQQSKVPADVEAKLERMRDGGGPGGHGPHFPPPGSTPPGGPTPSGGPDAAASPGELPGGNPPAPPQ